MDVIISSLRLPNQMAYLPLALAYVEALAVATGFDKQAVQQVVLALEEALANVIKHGFAPDERAVFDLTCEQTVAALAFTIHETGQPFDPGRTAVYRPDAVQDLESTAGLGMFLIQQSMDEVNFRNLGRAGKELRLVKYNRNARVDALAEKTPRPPTPALAGQSDPLQPPPDPPPNTSFSLRPLRPEEALEISRCAWQAYGYSYEDYIYYPERIVELNQKGLLQSFVAVPDDAAEIAGHLALKRNTTADCIAELGVGFVKPAFRNGGILKMMTNALITNARAQGLSGIFGLLVTSHAISQKAIYGFGARTCGVLLAQFPADVDFKKLTGKAGCKEHGLLMYLRLRAEPPRVIYAPDQHRDILDAIYAWLGETPVWREIEPGASLTNETELDSSAINVLNVGEIKIQRYGTDTVATVRAALRQHCLEHRDVIYLHLDLEAAPTAVLTAEFETLGFSFAGILPRSLHGHDALILQYLNNMTVEYAALRPYSAEAVQLLEYVQKQDPGVP